LSTHNILRPYVSIAADFKSGHSTPRTFLEMCLLAMDEREKDVRAFVHFDLDRARKQADESTERWRQGRPLSPYDGMPVGVKDIIETEDFPTEMGSPLFIGWKSGRDAAVVKALRAAGATIIGKTDTTEFASGFPNRTRNPWDLSRTPGGSSSGSAAGVAAGFLSTALGTQVVGSILRPSSFCGTIGFKPTIGGINRGGSHDFLSQSCTGVIGATIEDTWVLTRDLSWRAGGDPGFMGVEGPETLPEAKLPAVVAAFQTPGWAKAEEGSRQQFLDACQRLAARNVTVLTRETNVLIDEIEHDLTPCVELTRRLNAFESRWPYNVYAGMDQSKMSAHAQERLRLAFELTADDYRRDLRARERIRASYARLKDVVDCSIALSALGSAPVGRETGSASNVFPVCGSVLGVPAWGLPVLEVDGLPLGLQVWGYANQDVVVTALAAGMFQVLGRPQYRGIETP
jgi:Asp-tRNA(Asn)/Glu-tRNA(Gln) amidotransferase A subunit family amidase